MSMNTFNGDNDPAVLHWLPMMRETDWKIGFGDGDGPDDPRPFLYVADIEHGEYLATRPSPDSITDAMGDRHGGDFVLGGMCVNFQDLCNALGSALLDFGAAGSLHAQTNRYLVAAIALAYFVRTKAFHHIQIRQDEISNHTAMIVFRIPAPDRIGVGILRPLVINTTGELMTGAALADSINHCLTFDRHNHPDWFPSSGAIVDFRPRRIS